MSFYVQVFYSSCSNFFGSIKVKNWGKDERISRHWMHLALSAVGINFELIRTNAFDFSCNFSRIVNYSLQWFIPFGDRWSRNQATRVFQQVNWMNELEKEKERKDGRNGEQNIMNVNALTRWRWFYVSLNNLFHSWSFSNIRKRFDYWEWIIALRVKVYWNDWKFQFGTAKWMHIPSKSVHRHTSWQMKNDEKSADS